MLFHDNIEQGVRAASRSAGTNIQLLASLNSFG